MSNDSQKPETQHSGKSTPPSKQPQGNTETDLWDLEDDEEISSTDPAAKTEPSSIPSRRVSESSIQSKKPVERHHEAPISVAEIAQEETPASPGEKEMAEKKESGPETPENGSNTPSEKDETSSQETAPEGPVIKGYLATLTKIEKIGITALVAILALTATLSIIHFSDKVPIKALIAEDLDLPIEGELIKVNSVKTFWREPITGGENPDVVRRGVKLIPVIRMGIEGKSGAIRVLFRNENETVVGDNITRPVEENSNFEISATDGFDDVGMHAAYRTRDSEPWIVQVLEGPSVAAPMEQFRLVFETEISTDMR